MGDVRFEKLVYFGAHITFFVLFASVLRCGRSFL